MMTPRLCTAVCFLALATLPALVAAQPESGSLGLQVSLQSDQREIGLPWWIKDNFFLVPFVSVAHVSETGTDIGAGAMIRLALGDGDAVPYCGIRAGVMYFDPKADGDALVDYVVGPAVGGEYYFSPHFSCGVEAQVNVALSDQGSGRFGNPDGTTINTATAVFATFYF